MATLVMADFPSPTAATPDQVAISGTTIGEAISGPVQITERDIVFDCSRCGGELVIDQEGAGLSVHCPFCDSGLTVPEFNGPSLRFLHAATAKLAREVEAARHAAPKSYHLDKRSPEDLKRRQADLERELRECRVQATEVKGHVHHATIQLHRYQLKLEMILDRQSELKAELDAVRDYLKER